MFQIPIAEEFGWLRAEFSLAIAIQNLAWGVGQPMLIGTLYGIVFFSHQLGGFLEVWLGGRLYDLHGCGAFSAIVHLPVRERAMNGR